MPPLLVPFSMRRRRLVAALATLVVASPGAAQQDSDRTAITLIVPAARGGSADALGRLVADGLAGIMEIPFRVANIEGNGGVTGTTAIAAATRDGSMLGLAISSPMLGGKLLSRSARYNPIEDFDWLGIFGTYPNAMVLPSRSKHTGIEEWLAAAREANPPMTCGTAGTGSAGHLAAAYLRFEQKARLTHLTLDAMQDGYARLRDGTLDLMFDGVPSAIVNVPRTAQRIVAVTSMTRVPALLEVPSFGELWRESFELWIGLVAPKGLPAVVFARIASAVGVLIAEPRFADGMRAAGLKFLGLSGAGTRAFVEADFLRNAKLIAKLSEEGLRP